MNTVRVAASNPYDVLIGYGLLGSLGQELLKRHKPCRVALVSDEHVYDIYGKMVQQSLADAGFGILACVVPPGEATKSLRTCDSLLMRFSENGLTRDDMVLALGGGVIGDLAGFVASIYLRGIAYIQVPTTLLAAVDSSVGGKTGVNLPHGKNLVGAFWQPSLVLCDCDTLASLPTKVFLDGVAESLKYGVLCDRSLFEDIAQGALDGDCVDVITRCITIKAAVVAEDERETDMRKLLNLGHTMGHAIEMVSDFTVSHGHAIAIGMVGAARIAEALGICVMGCAGILMAMLDRLGLPCEITYDVVELADAAMNDKKRTGDQVTLVLPESIGSCVLHTVDIHQLPEYFRLAHGGRL